MKKYVKVKDKYICSESEFVNGKWETRYFHFFCDICGVRHPDVCVNDLCEEEGFPVGDYCWNCQMSMREQGFIGKDKTRYFWRDEVKEGQLNNNSYRIKLENI